MKSFRLSVLIGVLALWLLPATARAQDFTKVFDLDDNPPADQGYFPLGGLVRGPDGYLYGTTNQQGPSVVPFPDFPFNVTVWPAGTIPTTANSEILTVTAIDVADMLTVVRAQAGTIARAIVAGDQIAVTVSRITAAPVPDTTGTSLVVTAGQGALFPAIPFNVTVWPAGTIPTSTNSEILTVTAIAADTLTVVRARSGTTARAIVVGDQIAASLSAVVMAPQPATTGTSLVVTAGSTQYARPDGLGTIFRVLPDGSSFEVLKTFTLASLSTGANPAGLVRASDGNLYGTTEAGGAHDAGTIFRLKFSGNPPVYQSHELMYSFDCAAGEGGDPYSVLTEGPDGALYGTTDAVSFVGCGDGTVFKINKDASGFTTLSRFDYPVTGGYTWGPVAVARDGSIFGTTFGSGDGGPVSGAIFKVPAGGSPQPSVLYAFTGLSDGGYPAAGLVRGPDDWMYGTTTAGGVADGGTIFRISEHGEFQHLYSFSLNSLYGPDQLSPSLFIGGDGKIYGAVTGSDPAGRMDPSNPASPLIGFSSGGVFEFVPPPLPPAPLTGGQFRVVYAFKDDGSDGIGTAGTFTVGSDRHLYGANAYGGTYGAGTLFGLPSILIANRPPYPVATASPNPAVAVLAAGATVTLSGLGSSDADFDALSYTWTLPSGTSIESGSISDPTLQVRFPIGTSNVSLAVSDDGGTSWTQPISITVVVQDQPPTMSAVANITVPSTSASGAAVNYTPPTASDVIDGSVTVTCLPPPSTTFPIGSTTVICSATDTGGNTVTETFTVTVTDAVNVVVPSAMTVEANGPTGVTADVVTFAATASNFGSASLPVICIPTSGSTFGFGPTLVTCTASDAHGNSASASFYVTVQDTLPPMVIVPADVSVDAATSIGTVVTFSASAFDIVDLSRPVTCDPLSGSMFPTGTTTTVTCKASDLTGHEGLKSFTVTVTLSGPVVTVPADFTVEADRSAGRPVDYTALVSASDANGSVEVNCGPLASGSVFPLDVMTTVTCTATTDAGSDTKSFKVEVVDTTGPAVYTHGIITASTSPAGAALRFQGAEVNVSYDERPRAEDIVDGPTAVTCTADIGGATVDVTLGGTFPIGLTSLTCFAIDSHGNRGTNLTNTPLDNVIWVRDVDIPVLHLPGDVTTEATGPSGASVTFSVTATDPSDLAPIVSCNYASGANFPLGTATVTCSAIDHSSNSSDPLVRNWFMVRVVDTTPPAIPPLPDIVRTTSNPLGIPVTYASVPAEVQDLVNGSQPLVCSPVSGSTFLLGTTSVTCTSSDLNTPIPNRSTATFNVTVNFTSDATPPVITVPDDMVVEATGPDGATVVFTVTAVDAVDGNRLVTCVPASGSMFGLGTTTVTCTAADLSGNSASKSFNVTVVKKPTLRVRLTPGFLWPPNHKMVTIQASITATSEVGQPPPIVTLVSITSDEPDNGLGDGDRPDDIQGEAIGTDDRMFQLRAERSGRGNGRVYTVVYRATNPMNQDIFTTVVATVIVPSDMSGDEGRDKNGRDKNGKDRNERDDKDRDDSHVCDGRDGHDIHADRFRRGKR